MHKIFTVMMLLIATSLMADGINWAADYKSGIEKAKKENKPVLFIISKHTCPPCIKLEKETYTDKMVINAVNSDFVAIISYVDEHDYTPRSLFTGLTPSIWFLKPNGEPMYDAIKGAPNTKNFLYYLGVVKQAFDKNTKSGK